MSEEKYDKLFGTHGDRRGMTEEDYKSELEKYKKAKRGEKEAILRGHWEYP